jgi:DNA-binding NtrC family response regulator
MSQAHIVVVDDDESTLDVTCQLLVAEGYQVTGVRDARRALELLKETPVQVVLTDLRMPGMDGCEMIERIAQADSQIACIVMTGYGTVEHAVKAMKAGAYDFITKPIQIEAVSLVVRKALELQRLRQENLLLRKTVREKYSLHQLVGASDAIQSVHDFVQKVADSDSTVLIQGESGTGKELIARMLHFNSARRDRPLVPVNCGAIPENLLESELFGHEKGAFTGAVTARTGRFELAHGGTIFLDEIGEMSPALQVKLLRVLQERCFERVGGTKTIKVDVRVLAATNQDLERAIQENRFRADLYYRLHIIPITVPPLRERVGDVPLLAAHFLRQFNASKQADIHGVDPQAMEALTNYRWPGNIRELENLIERLVILKKRGQITVDDLPPKILGDRPVRAVAAPVMEMREPSPSLVNGGIHLAQEVEQYEHRLIAEAMRLSNGVTSKAAQLLKMNRTTLVEKLKRKRLGGTGVVEHRAASAHAGNGPSIA